MDVKRCVNHHWMPLTSIIVHQFSETKAETSKMNQQQLETFMYQVSIFLILQKQMEQRGNVAVGSLPIHHHYQQQQQQQQSIMAPSTTFHINPYTPTHPKEFIYLPLGLALDVNEVLDCLRKRYLNTEISSLPTAPVLAPQLPSTHSHPQYMHPSFPPHDTSLSNAAVPSMDYYCHNASMSVQPVSMEDHLGNATFPCESHRSTLVVTETAKSGTTKKRKSLSARPAPNGTKRQTLKGKKQSLGAVKNDNTGKKIQFFQYSYTSQ